MLAGRRQMVSTVIDGGQFDICTMAFPSWVAGAPLSVYIEGDGYAFINRHRLSDDPTPRRPVALELAVRDPAPNVVYLARPCQYVTGAHRRNCHPAYWSVARYAEEVVAAINAAIDRLLTVSGAPRVALYGYSGGGAVALLVAARRSDVLRVVTVAGVLDSDTWTGLDGMAPLSASLNPADLAARLVRVPQWHFVGAKDTVVSAQVARSYAARFPTGQMPVIRVVPGMDHDCCWADHWPELLRQADGNQ